MVTATRQDFYGDMRSRELLLLSSKRYAPTAPLYSRLHRAIAEDEARFYTRATLTARVRDASGTPVYRAVLTLEGQPLQ